MYAIRSYYARFADAQVALVAGADYLGFVVKHDGPRCVPAEHVEAIVSELPGAVAVAVMVAPQPDEALRLAESAGAARVQLHRVDPSQWPADFPLPTTFAVPIAEDGSITVSLPDIV